MHDVPRISYMTGCLLVKAESSTEQLRNGEVRTLKVLDELIGFSRNGFAVGEHAHSRAIYSKRLLSSSYLA